MNVVLFSIVTWVDSGSKQCLEGVLMYCVNVGDDLYSCYMNKRDAMFSTLLIIKQSLGFTPYRRASTQYFHHETLRDSFLCNRPVTAHDDQIQKRQ